MMRQFLFRGLILGTVVIGSTGCESLHSMVRHHDKDEVSRNDDSDDSAKPNSVGSDVSKLQSVDSTGKNNQPFFNPTRGRSAFSSFSPEAQDIEKNLGVY